jgi:hypothetical protein
MYKPVNEIVSFELIVFIVRSVNIFLIPNYCRAVYVVCFLLGNSPASEFYMPMFQNTLSVPSS